MNNRILELAKQAGPASRFQPFQIPGEKYYQDK